MTDLVEATLTCCRRNRAAALTSLAAQTQVGKKVQKYDTAIEETMEKLLLSSSKLEEAEKEFTEKDDDVSNMSRRIMLIEEEGRINEEKMANTVLKLANMSKDADNIVKGCRFWESKVMNNEV